MALLTADDIRDKRFGIRRFREGYDIDEVDDYLDEIIGTLDALQSENQQLRTAGGGAETDQGALAGLQAQVQELQARNAELEQAGGGAQAESLRAESSRLADENKALRARVEELQGTNASLRREVEASGGNDQALDQLRSEGERLRAEGQSLRTERDTLQSQLQAADRQISELQEQARQAESSPQTGSIAAIQGAGSSSGSDAARATAMLDMAQRLHDEYVDKGKQENARLITEGRTEHDNLIGEGHSEHDRLINEGQSEHDRLIGEGSAEHDRLIGVASAKHDQIVREAEETSQRTYAQLAKERATIERKIDDLRTFERDYRTRLKGFLQNLLGEVDRREAGSSQGDGQA